LLTFLVGHRIVRVVDALNDTAAWHQLVDDYESAHRTMPVRRAKTARYRAVIASGEISEMGAAVAGQRHWPGIPEEAAVNKAGGRRKTVYIFPPAEELLQKALNRALQPIVDTAISPLCHSFLPGRGARSAFRSLLADGDIGQKAALRLDVRNYFNSIDIDRLWGRLPATITDDRPLALYLERFLRSPWVLRRGRLAAVPAKGVMAGSALAPLLSNLALAGLDDHFAGLGVTYARYSDDIAVFDDPAALAGHEGAIRGALAADGLAVNEEKTSTSAPGAPWEFLGLRYDGGGLDVSANALRKVRARVGRVARRLERDRGRRGAGSGDLAHTVRRFVLRLNRSFYGLGSGDNDFSWATWFFPLLTTDATLGGIDRFVQDQVRWAATGRRTARVHRALPYADLRALGYLPLVPAYWAYRSGREVYDDLVRSRTGWPASS
jgi:hypothetical protein